MTFLIASIAYYALLLFFLLMWGRFVLDLAQSFSRGWRPKGPVLVLAEIAYTVTDPPIKAVRRVLPPVRLGSVALDFGWSLIMLAVVILMGVASGLRYA
ncbi:YggT family protein [Frigoribacterium sp. ACAM 257]|uniref:YggT family protein n=1 Tax=Frigoribacterium sp. ACAM 257 TaxID=2508998 RepID=UPI0011B9A903|nr:YggT family protein [Frigoribacterium sp. ACAM 257]TWX40851.1 YggT family protein [Frigoribacterium sp. ACAM 257]